ncbi:response regulator transcription factor [Pseudonocardia sp. KRD291]|uniref:response regulator transcription factor n=1 Tax=Pseudonocardia sp. KRD291 TaxID=2792007 RepID=UPI001C49E361|nr:helix-turn-helix transcriptional regulator [Pseudonocardia sp. KRD291]MBW0106278.1 helix-turn-helix transcriptional regulator [Pseudonocardia sp. KRD291]
MPLMPAERARAQLGGLAAAGLDAPVFAAGAIEILRAALPFSAACLATTDPATELVTSTVKWQLTDENDEEWAYQEYEVEQYNSIDVARRPGGVTTAAQETGGDLASLRRFSEFFVPRYGFGDELRATSTVDGAVWGFVALFRDGPHASFTPAELEFAASVSTLFGRGLRSGLVAGAVDGGATADGPAVIVVDGAGEIVQAGIGAAARVADLGGAPLGTGPLPFPLVTLVGAARRYSSGRLDVLPRTRLRSRSGQWVVAHASPLTSRDGRCTDVVLTIEEARPPEIVPLVVAAFGLTPREQEVVRLVLQGSDTAEIARSLHLSAYTVQDHLKSVFDKVGVRSRRELTARVFFDQYAPRLAAASGVAPSGWFAPAV